MHTNNALGSSADPHKQTVTNGSSTHLVVTTSNSSSACLVILAVKGSNACLTLAQVI